MSYRLQVIRSSDFVRVDANGRPNMEETQAALRKVAESCIERGVDHALIDARDAQTTLSITDLFVLASTFGNLGFQRHHRLAFVHRLGAGERADFFAMCANDRGWQVGSFDSFEEAFNWLNDEAAD